MEIKMIGFVIKEWNTYVVGKRVVLSQKSKTP